MMSGGPCALAEAGTEGATGASCEWPTTDAPSASAANASAYLGHLPPVIAANPAALSAPVKLLFVKQDG